MNRLRSLISSSSQSTTTTFPRDRPLNSTFYFPHTTSPSPHARDRLWPPSALEDYVLFFRRYNGTGVSTPANPPGKEDTIFQRPSPRGEAISGIQRIPLWRKAGFSPYSAPTYKVFRYFKEVLLTLEWTLPNERDVIASVGLCAFRQMENCL